MALRKKPPTTLLLTDMSSLYGYIYCMLISEGLSGMPLYGGALYMIGRVTTVFAQTFSPEEAIYLPKALRWMRIPLMILLLLLSLSSVPLLPPLLPYVYQHPRYWQVVQEETKGSGNLLSSRRIFHDTEDKAELTDAVMIPVENIRGRLMMIGCEDDSLWETAHYIRRIDERLKTRAHECRYEALIYEHGTHFAFSESMLRQIIPIFPDFLTQNLL